jgi:hypothetical protein
MDIHEAVVCLANWRKRTEDAQAKVKAMMNALMESPEYKQAAQESMEAHQMMCETEDTVRALAVDFYTSTGDKRAHEAVSVKVFPELEYDPAIALNYCTEHLHSVLKLDTKAFEKAAKVIPLSFVEVREVPKAQISTDLSAYL